MDEEQQLGTYLKHCAKVGYGKTRRDVVGIVSTVATEKGVLRGGQVSTGWWHRFLERQKDLSLRQGDSTAHVRMDAMNCETMQHYFTLLEDTLEQHDLLNCPSQIYNVVESGMPLNPRPPKVVSTKGRQTKKVRYRCSGRKGQITIVACANAVGQAIPPPMVIFSANKLNPAWTKGEIPGTQYGLSTNGWINTDLFEAWFVEHFLPNAVSARPLFLLLDGHSTHYQPRVLCFAKEHDCIILCLPPHTTHESQPLDVGVFAPLKVQWSKVCHYFYQKNPGRVINNFNFSSLFSEAWCRAVTPVNIMSGFRRAGVYPLNPEAVAITEQPDHSHSEDSPSTQPMTHDSPEASAESVPSPEPVPSAGSSLASTLHLSATCDAAGPSFTQEQIRHFETRYEEGFDIADDQDYINWLRINHPDSPKNQVQMEVVKSCHASIAQHFADVSPLQQISIGDVPDSPPSALLNSENPPATSLTPPSALQNSQSTPSTSRTPPSALQNSQSTPSTSRTPPSALQNSQSTPSTSRTPPSTLHPPEQSEHSFDLSDSTLRPPEQSEHSFDLSDSTLRPPEQSEHSFDLSDSTLRPPEQSEHSFDLSDSTLRPPEQSEHSFDLSDSILRPPEQSEHSFNLSDSILHPAEQSEHSFNLSDSILHPAEQSEPSYVTF